MVRLRGDVAAAREAHSSSQREVTRLSLLIASKETELQTMKYTMDAERNQRLQLKEELVEALKNHKEVFTLMHSRTPFSNII